MEAWQLLHGYNPSLKGGGGTENSLRTSIAKDGKKIPNKNKEKTV
jgi:hypothetical protein